MAQEVYCHYQKAWVPLGRARKRCPHCGANLDGTHRVRDPKAAQDAAARLFQSEPIVFAGTTITPQAIDVGDRASIVRRCTDAALLRQARDAPDLQATVRQAIERRLRALR